MFAAAADSSNPGQWAIFITALAALGAAILSGLAIWLEGRRTRLQLGINNLWSLIQQWDAADMRRRRCELARHLLKHPEARREVSREGTEVLNVFELLAYLVVRSKTLKLEDAWVNFSPWAAGWWYALEEGIDTLRAHDETIYEDYATLVAQFDAYEIKRGIPLAEDPQEGIDQFLGDESALLGPPGEHSRDTHDRFWFRHFRRRG